MANNFETQKLHKRWAYRKLDPVALRRFLDDHEISISPNDPAEQTSRQLEDYLAMACDTCMPPRSHSRNNRKPVHWWSSEITELRAKSLKAKRAYTRARRRDPVLSEALSLDFRATRMALKIAIRAAQDRSWKELCDLVENDPWGLPYKLVAKKLGVNPSGAEARGREENIADFLFPSRPPIDWNQIPIDISIGEEYNVEEFTPNELVVAANKLPTGKACGPDGIPNEVLSIVVRTKPQILLGVFNQCLRQSVFPVAWKEARLVLLHKSPGKPYDAPSSYRPLSVLNTTGKILKRLILSRINRFLESTEGAMSPLQFGFRAGRSTEDAIKIVTNSAKEAATGAVQNRDLCVLVCLDVRNAFNSAPWHLIDAALRKKKVHPSLVRLIRSYLQDRKLLVSPGVERLVWCGVLQGSVIGPVLWNIFYDEVLTLPVPSNIKIVAFAHDIAMIGTAHTGPLLEESMNDALESIHTWMTNNGLEIAPKKTEAMMLTRKWASIALKLRIAGHDVSLQKSVKYLGVTLDQSLTFSPHVERVTKSAAETARSIGRLLQNVGGPSYRKRFLLSTVVTAKIMYASPVWAEVAFKSAKNRQLDGRTQRLIALRITRAYRTVAMQH